MTTIEVSRFSLSGARSFADKYREASSEKRLGQSFWRDFFAQVVDIDDLMSAGIEFEYPVRSERGTINFIDVFWPGVLLVEQKSEGKSLDQAEKQARDYLIALTPLLRPPTIVVSDFRRIRIIEVLAGTTFEFALDALPENLPRLELAIGKLAAEATKPELAADQKAVELMADLFVEFEKAGYEGHELSVFLVRILFLNFGDDTRMWKRTARGLFADLVEASSPDGMGVGGRLQELFQTLNTPTEKRASTLSAAIADFPYVNGGLFSENLSIISFTTEMREALRKTTEYDWSKISPAIFGAMFQTVKSKEDRRSLGEHYTSEANILRVIRPLFLDEFTEKLRKAWGSPTALKRFHAELAAYNYLDPACGSGNFLVVAYKRLRAIELKLMARLQELQGRQGDVFLDGRMGLSVTLEQFHGIEINEWSSQIATVAMYLADHQANLEMEEITGFAPNAFPLNLSANIVHQNALRIDWRDVVEVSSRTFILGNPPFYGARWQDAQQKEDTRRVWENTKNVGELDFVTNWFLLAAKISEMKKCSVAFVATSSVSQGEQAAILWGKLRRLGMAIDFAYRPFSWSNEASGRAGVHVVIIGFSSRPKTSKIPLWSFARGRGIPTMELVKEINAYLLAAPDILITPRKTPLVQGIPQIDIGSMPNDGGHLSNLSAEEADKIRASDPIAAKYLRRLIGARELIHDEKRFALWLVGAEPNDIRNSPELRVRIDQVRRLRDESRREATRRLAFRPTEFGENRQPKTDFIAVPRITSEGRDYVPLGFFPPEVIANDKISLIEGGRPWLFGILSSRPFNVWNKAISGRTRNDTLISNSITYNNFPFPIIDTKLQARLDDAAQSVLLARESFKKSSLADLYDSNSMPPSLRTAHEKLDGVVLRAYLLPRNATDSQILTKLFEGYSELVGGIIGP